MKLFKLNKYYFIFIFIVSFFLPAIAEDSIDIWKKKTDIQKTNAVQSSDLESKEKNIISENKINEEQIKSSSIETLEENLYGIFDPDTNNLKLDMWRRSDGEKIKNAFTRINKINLSKSAEELFINTILTYSYLPAGLNNDEFLDLKIKWLIKNNKDNLLEEFLNKNDKFSSKDIIIQYLVDRSIAKANLNEGCKKSDFISKEVKNSYLEKFKIYCLIFNDKKNEAQLLFDILREQKMSDKFFNNKINFLLGISDQTDEKIRDDNLLNFYLSSVTVPNFSYEPKVNTNTFIWEYLNAANLVKVDDVKNLEKIKNLENAANRNDLNKDKIFDIYKKLPFDLNSLINAEEIYQSLDEISARALIYQKFLLSDDVENKIKLLLLLKELFAKEKLENVYTQFMSNKLAEIDEKNIPASLREAVSTNIINEVEYNLGKIKYDDKILHRSRVIKFYTESNASIQKSQKDLNNVYKKIKKNKKYFFSVKDLILTESLEIDGFVIPKDINNGKLSSKYNIPESLLVLLENGETGLLALKFVEIIGEDEISSLDPETIYFITHLLNKANLVKIRNKILISALPLRS